MKPLEELHQLKEGANMPSSVLDACRAGVSDVNVKLDDRHAVWAAFKGQLEEVRQDVHAKLNEMDAGHVGVEEQLLQVQQLVRDVEVRVSGGCAARDLEKVLKRVDLGERATDTLKEDDVSWRRQTFHASIHMPCSRGFFVEHGRTGAVLQVR